ncbi:MAG: DUF4062 domain-containing protein [Bacteroidota bacterium]|nr:DUF4062 domain-containing protein [Bacteroidota bacterium]
MATPRVFVSSTCYDLNEIRDSLYSFISSLNYVPVFSDKNDVFYHPDMHTHDSCIKEVETCQLFVLIIGGRFGGKYHLDTEKSIVNAEYAAARHLKIPIFTFIKREVYEDHRQFSHNKVQKPDLYDQFYYSAIDKQEHAINIFDFVNEVRKNDINNAIFSFEYGREIKDILLKQFAGLFYDFLWQRLKKSEFEKTEKLLTDLTVLSKKTEEIIENIYKQVDTKNAVNNLEKIELETDARRFWINIIREFGVVLPVGDVPRMKELSNVNKTESWVEYLLRTGKFKIIDNNVNENKLISCLYHEGTKEVIALKAIKGELTAYQTDTLNKINKYFKAFAMLTNDKREELLNGMA